MPYNLTNADNFTDSFLTTFAVTLVGGFLGYNKRKSRVFLYVSLVCALVLMALLSFISSNPQVLKGNNGS
ncbi:MAG: hypothetical protein D6780_08195 [Candidatus Dadabacteria bacterium]|nr:MAG: hypothetical protein D6780_08195 [Candidatus Dadabacteria bacterium]